MSLINDEFDFEDIAPEGDQENEEDIHNVDNVDNDFGNAVIYNTDWTVETIFRQMEKGNINLTPEYQRRDAWNVDRKSKLIESIICGFPIPNIVLAEDKKHKGKYIVIDGKQRLFSIQGFLKDEYKLKSLLVRKDLNTFTYSGLAQFPDIVNTIENQPIRTVIIKNWPNEDYLYTVFFRLNSGSLPLSPQELRKALHGGILLNYLEEYMLDSKIYKQLFGEKLDKRMRDVELVLRYVSFERSYERYVGDLKTFLDNEVIYFNTNWDTEKIKLDELLNGLDTALATTYAVFGKDAFKKWNGEKFEHSINRAVFDTLSRYFSDKKIEDKVLENKEKIINEFKNICINNQSFKDAIERSTKLTSATRNRYIIWGKALAKILNLRLDEDKMRLY